MKTKTKKKLITWFTKLINYKEYMDAGSYIVLETRKIQKVRSQYTYLKKELNLISEEQIRFGLNLPLIDELGKTGGIKYIRELDQIGDTIITAELKFILP